MIKHNKNIDVSQISLKKQKILIAFSLIVCVAVSIAFIAIFLNAPLEDVYYNGYLHIFEWTFYYSYDHTGLGFDNIYLFIYYLPISIGMSVLYDISTIVSYKACNKIIKFCVEIDKDIIKKFTIIKKFILTGCITLNIYTIIFLFPK